MVQATELKPQDRKDSLKKVLLQRGISVEKFNLFISSVKINWNIHRDIDINSSKGLCK
jgi:hypothetical protein